MKLTVLVVEDDADLRVSLVDVLRSKGYDVIEAPDGLVARQVLQEQLVDVVILDLRLPGLDGPGLLAGVDDALPVVVLSGFVHFDQDEICRRLAGKVTTFIRKPSPPHVVLSAIEDVIRG
jgi:DNA-binding response OmpR family regulator